MFFYIKLFIQLFKTRKLNIAFRDHAKNLEQYFPEKSIKWIFLRLDELSFPYSYLFFAYVHSFSPSSPYRTSLALLLIWSCQ